MKWQSEPFEWNKVEDSFGGMKGGESISTFVMG